MLADRIVQASSQKIIIPQTPIAEYTMDSISGGILYDTGPNAYNGNIVGASVVPGKIGNALSFNGTANYVGLVKSTKFNKENLTVTAWINTSFNHATDGEIFQSYFRAASEGSLNNSGYGLYLSGNKVVGQFNTKNAAGDTVYGHQAVSTSIINDGIWKFITIKIVTGTTSRIYLYVNGVIESSSPVITQKIQYNDGSYAGQPTIGVWEKENDTRINWLNGTVDQLRVYDRALSGAEILQLYNNGMAA
jgi:hypothetical protein